MKLTIIPSDNTVYVDKVSQDKLELLDIPLNIHALQWQDTQGHIEFSDSKPNEDIIVLPDWANNAVTVWTVSMDKFKAENLALGIASTGAK